MGSLLIRGSGWGPSHDLGDAFHLWDIDGGEGQGEGGERMGEAWNPRIPPCQWVLPAKEWHLPGLLSLDYLYKCIVLFSPWNSQRKITC